MTKNENQRLCGGTFFTLLLQARKSRKGVREHYRGESDGLSDPEIHRGHEEDIEIALDADLSSHESTGNGDRRPRRHGRHIRFNLDSEEPTNSNAENEIYQSYRESALDKLNKNFNSIKTVLANRNYEE